MSTLAASRKREKIQGWTAPSLRTQPQTSRHYFCSHSSSQVWGPWPPFLQRGLGNVVFPAQQGTPLKRSTYQCSKVYMSSVWLVGFFHMSKLGLPHPDKIGTISIIPEGSPLPRPC